MPHPLTILALAATVATSVSAQNLLGNSNPNGFATADSAAYTLFAANDQSTGMELWRHDFGGATTRAADIRVGGLGANPRSITPFLNGFAFVASDGLNGTELYYYDGSTAGMVDNIHPTSSSWPDDLTVVGSLLFFTADDGTHGRELWKFDGTSAALVADINPITSPNPIGSDPGELFANGTELLFAADDGVHGRELWRSSGTGAAMLADIWPSSGSSNPGSNPHDFASVLVPQPCVVFAAADALHGIELWQLTGTTATLLRDLEPGANGSAPQLLGSFVYAMYAATTTATGREPWRTDGTTAGTVPIDVKQGAASSNPADLVFGGIFDWWFVADGGTGGREIWSVSLNGTGLTPRTNLFASFGDVGPTHLVRTTASKFVFGDATGRNLWATNGSPIGAGVIGSFVDGPIELTENVDLFGGRQALFAANDGTHGTEPWLTDGVTVSMIRDIAPPGSGFADPHFQLDVDSSGTTITSSILAGPAFGNSIGLVAFSAGVSPPISVPGVLVGPLLITLPLLVTFAVFLDPLGSGNVSFTIPPNSPTAVFGAQAFVLDLSGPGLWVATDSASLGTMTQIAPPPGGTVHTTATFNDRDHRYGVSLTLSSAFPAGTFVVRHRVVDGNSSTSVDVPGLRFPYDGTSTQVYLKGETTLEELKYFELYFIDSNGGETLVAQTHC